MKKSIGIFIAAILVVCLFAGCAETASTENAGAAETPAVPAAAESAGTAAESAGTEPAAAENEYAWDPNIGANPEKNEYYFVFVPKLVHPFYEPLIEGMERAAAEYAEQGITVTWDWDAPAAADAVLQTEKMEAAAAKSPDVLGVAVQDPVVIDPIVDEIEAAGIPVMLFADDTASGAGSGFVGLKDFYGQGYMVGKEIAEAMNGEGEVGLLMGSLAAVSHQGRLEGIKGALAEYPGITIVSEQATDDDLQKAVEVTEQMMNANPGLNAVISADGSGAAGAARAVADSGHGKIWIGGFDVNDENIEGVKDGSIYCTAAQDGIETGYDTLRMMIDIADGKITHADKREVWVNNMKLMQDTLADYGY